MKMSKDTIKQLTDDFKIILEHTNVPTKDWKSLTVSHLWWLWHRTVSTATYKDAPSVLRDESGKRLLNFRGHGWNPYEAQQHNDATWETGLKAVKRNLVL